MKNLIFNIRHNIKQLANFQKMQLWSSIIPLYSSLFVVISTYIVFPKNRAPYKYHIKFIISTVIFFCLFNLYNNLFDSGSYIVLKIIGFGVLSALYNFYLVFLQVKCIKEHKEKLESGTQDTKIKIPLKLIVAVGAIVVTATLVFIAVYLVNAFKTGVIEDTNGSDDFSLCTMTKDDITDNVYGPSKAFFVSGKATGERSNIDDKRLEYVDHTKSTKSAKSFNGISVIQATKTDKDSLKINITSTVESGNFVIAIIVDGEYYSDVEINSTQEITLANIANKTVLVKIAGEDAKMSVEVTREIIG